LPSNSLLLPGFPSDRDRPPLFTGYRELACRIDLRSAIDPTLRVQGLPFRHVSDPDSVGSPRLPPSFRPGHSLDIVCTLRAAAGGRCVFVPPDFDDFPASLPPPCPRCSAIFFFHGSTKAAFSSFPRLYDALQRCPTFRNASHPTSLVQGQGPRRGLSPARQASPTGAAGNRIFSSLRNHHCGAPRAPYVGAILHF